MSSTGSSRQPEVLPSDSSDSDADLGDLFGPQTLKMSQWSHKQSRRSPGDSRAAASCRPSESPPREGLDRELKAFIDLRDQTDTATEVRASGLLFTVSCEIQIIMKGTV